MKYFDECKRAMEYLAQDDRTLFMGQAVAFPGTAVTRQLENVSPTKKLELPVCEEMQMGMTIGLALDGYVPVSIYPRWNFLLLATNQLVNHLDKINYFTDNQKKFKCIIKVVAGSERPLFPGRQHVGDFSDGFRQLLETVEIIQLKEPEQIQSAYEHALYREDNKSTIIVEYGDFYNEK